MENKELVKAINQLQKAITYGSSMITGALLVIASVINFRPESGILGLIPSIMGLSGGFLLMYVGTRNPDLY